MGHLICLLHEWVSLLAFLSPSLPGSFLFIFYLFQEVTMSLLQMSSLCARVALSSLIFPCQGWPGRILKTSNCVAGDRTLQQCSMDCVIFLALANFSSIFFLFPRPFTLSKWDTLHEASFSLSLAMIHCTCVHFIFCLSKDSISMQIHMTQTHTHTHKHERQGK